MEGLVHGGAYFWNFTVPHFEDHKQEAAWLKWLIMYKLSKLIHVNTKSSANKENIETSEKVVLFAKSLSQGRDCFMT